MTAVTLISPGCGTTTGPYYGTETLRPDHNFIHLIARMSEDNAFSVPRVDRDQHQRCVFFALENAKIGENCNWINHKSAVTGSVRVVHTYPTGSRICHVFFSSLNIANDVKHWEDTACWSELESKWIFIGNR